jgi:hypothetical protein
MRRSSLSGKAFAIFAIRWILSSVPGSLARAGSSLSIVGEVFPVGAGGVPPES